MVSNKFLQMIAWLTNDGATLGDLTGAAGCLSHPRGVERWARPRIWSTPQRLGSISSKHKVYILKDLDHSPRPRPMNWWITFFPHFLINQSAVCQQEHLTLGIHTLKHILCCEMKRKIKPHPLLQGAHLSSSSSMAVTLLPCVSYFDIWLHSRLCAP